jgi:uncharacterized protein
LRIIPRDEQFYEMFAQLARRLTGCAELLQELFRNPKEIERYVTEIKRLEHEADNLTRDVIDRIDRTFVTPFDREDIHSLASELDDVIDYIDGTARRALIFSITKSPELAHVLVEVLVRAARCVEQGVHDMKNPKAVSAANEQLQALEEEGDAIFHDAIGKLFSPGADPLQVIIWKELYDKIEDALDQCEDVGNALQSIALKNA